MIPYATLKAQFEVVIDELQTAFFDDEQIESFINQAQLFWFHRWLYPMTTNEMARPDRVAYAETSKQISSALAPFLNETTGTTGPDGRISTNITNTSGRELYQISNMRARIDGSGLQMSQVRYRARPELSRLSELAMSAPDATNIAITIQSDFVQLHPKVKMNYEYEGVYSPQSVAAGVTNSQFKDAHLYHLVYKAAELASVSVRDYQFAATMQQEIMKL